MLEAMRLIPRVYLGLLLLFITLVSQARAGTWILSDVDDTLVETRQSNKGTFSTPFRLFRINFRSTSLQSLPSGEESILVSPQELERMKPYLAPSESQPGTAIGRTHSLADGRKIKPSEYYIRDIETFKYFNASPPGKNYILRDFKRAEAMDPEQKFLGPFFPIMQQILSHPESAANFGILTARGHEHQEWIEFFDYLIAQNYIQYRPNLNYVHALSRNVYDIFGPTLGGGERKPEFFKEFINHLARSILRPEVDLRLSPDGDRLKLMHFVLIAEDRKDLLEAMVRHAQAISRDGRIPVKFGFFNSGTKTQITESQRPQFSVVKSDGSFRPGTMTELLGEPRHLRGDYATLYEEKKIIVPILNNEDDRNHLLSARSIENGCQNFLKSPGE